MNASAEAKTEQRRHWRQQRQLAMVQRADALTAAVHQALTELQRPGRLGLFWPLGAEARLIDPPPPWPGGGWQSGISWDPLVENYH